MWNRRENESPSTPSPSPGRDESITPSREFAAAPVRSGAIHNEGIVNIGQSICIRGELTGDEDLTIEGRVEGKIDLKEHNLTIGPKGRIQAEVRAKTVIVRGEVNGNVNAQERVELAETGRVIGDIVSPRIIIADGARFKGSVDMTGSDTVPKAKTDGKSSTQAAANAPVISDSLEQGAARAAARS